MLSFYGVYISLPAYSKNIAVSNYPYVKITTVELLSALSKRLNVLSVPVVCPRSNSACRHSVILCKDTFQSPAATEHMYEAVHVQFPQTL